VIDDSGVILAIASGGGRSARGIVRVSGAEAFAAVGSLVELEAGDAEEAAWRRGARRGVLRLDDRELACVCVMFPGPGSYTGEDAVEIQVPGHPVLLERVMDALLASAAGRGLEVRRATAGEFTARAFVHGRIGLTEAEGVAATIAARSDAELRAARHLAEGDLARLARGLGDEGAALLALVEAGIDFTDQEDVVPIPAETLRPRLDVLERTLADCLDRAVGRERIEAIPWVVLTGPPNTGKSTLFNALLHRTRAVVSPVAGTTRDVLAEPLAIDTDHGPAEVMLVDLAGDDEGPMPLEAAMRRHAREALDRAELIMACDDGGGCGDEAPGDRAAIVRVRTKIDLEPHGDAAPADADADAAIRVSVHTGEGVDRLRREIAARLGDRAVSLAADALVLGARHEAALRAARAGVHEAIALVPAGVTGPLAAPELIAAALRAALDALADLAGDVTPDDVLGRIFSSFCVGK
jgi:tRNA modification GTPase